MASRGRTPEKGLRIRTWSHDRCNEGKERTGWLSGDMCVLLCHVGKGKSKPCEKELLGPKAKCPGCAEGRPREDLGYVPLRRDDGRPMCVVIRKNKLEFVEGLKLGSCITWGRDEGRFEGVWIRLSMKGVPWHKLYSEPPRDDLSGWLATFFGTPHLHDAMKVYLSPHATEQPADEPIPDPVEPIVTPLSQKPVPEKSLPEELASKTLDETITRMRKRFTTTAESRNGVHQE